MTNTDTAHDDVRDARIDAIADELVSLAGNDPATVREAAALAKSFKIGEPVQHVRQPHLSGIVGNSVTETLCIGLTTEAAGLSAAYCFVNPANLARIDAALATTTQPDTDMSAIRARKGGGA